MKDLRQNVSEKRTTTALTKEKSLLLLKLHGAFDDLAEGSSDSMDNFVYLYAMSNVRALHACMCVLNPSQFSCLSDQMLSLLFPFIEMFR